LSWRYVTVAAEAALRAGAIQLEHYGQDVKVEKKGDIDLVTEVDHACEAAILEVIRDRFPEHDILAEESDSARTGSRYVWIVDPLDGTTNFAHSYPMFSVSIALTVDGESVVGVVFDPLRDELFTAERGAGAHLNGKRLKVTGEDRLIQSLIITGFPYDLHERLVERLTPFIRVMGRARAVRRAGSAAIDLSYVAAGRADGFWEAVLKPWDMAAGRLMVEEAGGRVTRFDGSKVTVGPDEIAATNGRVHDELLAALREELPEVESELV
jgi:myo-inositol-1(or 4)-monophosphatase